MSHESSPEPAPETVRTVVRQISEFATGGEAVAVGEIPSGLINATFRVTVRRPDGDRADFILQRVNARVFADPQAVMGNVERVTRHVAGRLAAEDPARLERSLRLCPTRDGRPFRIDGAGDLWRCFPAIAGCRTHDVVGTPRQAGEAARAFGEFQRLLSDLPACELVETIPRFHDTPHRYARLREVAAADPCGRSGGVGGELAFLRERADDLGRIVDGLADGTIPRRVTHNDTKINNVLFDIDRDVAVCVIDLDTVMPGSLLHDFGDLVRSSVNPAGEGERDLTRVGVRMPVFEALAAAYLEELGDELWPRERELLAESARLITLELAIRFLTDHLEGDRYFRSVRPGQNLDRCRAQLRLAGEMEARMDEMERIVG